MEVNHYLAGVSMLDNKDDNPLTIVLETKCFPHFLSYRCSAHNDQFFSHTASTASVAHLLPDVWSGHEEMKVESNIDMVYYNKDSTNFFVSWLIRVLAEK